MSTVDLLSTSKPGNYTVEVEKRIFITFQFEAIHRWDTCPFEDVAFLRAPHRHIFHVRMEKIVLHNDRDVEFIMWKRKILEYVRGHLEGQDLGNTSCENLAETFAIIFDSCKVEVSEDGENGAIYTKTVREFPIR